MTYAQRLRKLADSTGLDAFGDEIRAIADEMDAQPADVTDEQINAVALEQWGPHAGGPLAAHRAFARAILALRPERAPMTGDQWTDVLGSAGPDMLDLAKQWADNKVHVYQVVNEAEKIVKAAVLRGIAAQAKKEGA